MEDEKFELDERVWHKQYGLGTVTATDYKSNLIVIGVDFDGLPFNIRVMGPNLIIKDKNNKLLFKQSKRLYMTEREHYLTYVGEPLDKPILVGEMYPKWYSLYLINPDGSIEKHIPDIDEVGFCDECYNPDELVEYCEKHNLYLDEITSEINESRWLNR